MSEYEMLRAEILERKGARSQYDNILYTSVAAILTYAFSQGNYFSCLVPYIVIIPVYLLNEGAKRAIVKLGTYAYVFLEGEEKGYNWQIRLWEYDKITYSKRSKYQHYFYLIKTRIHYFLLVFICSFSAVYEIIVSDMSNDGKWKSSVFVLILMVLSIIIMITNMVDYGKLQKQQIRQWSAVKEAEEQAKKRKNNDSHPQ